MFFVLLFHLLYKKNKRAVLVVLVVLVVVVIIIVVVKYRRELNRPRSNEVLPSPAQRSWNYRTKKQWVYWTTYWKLYTAAVLCKPTGSYTLYLLLMMKVLYHEFYCIGRKREVPLTSPTSGQSPTMEDPEMIWMAIHLSIVRTLERDSPRPKSC